MTTCSIDGCERKHDARGYCGVHYGRLRAHGDPMKVVRSARYRSPEESFLARTEPLLWSSCIVWTGNLNSAGYGQLRVNGRLVKAHRYAWEREHGPIPDGMFIDHICHERSCVNVAHLRLATPQQNSQNLSGAQSGRDLPRGVTRSGRGYAARVQRNGRNHHLGTFDTPELASAAAATARSTLFGIYAGNA